MIVDEAEGRINYQTATFAVNHLAQPRATFAVNYHLAQSLPWIFGLAILEPVMAFNSSLFTNNWCSFITSSNSNKRTSVCYQLTLDVLWCHLSSSTAASYWKCFHFGGNLEDSILCSPRCFGLDRLFHWAKLLLFLVIPSCPRYHIELHPQNSISLVISLKLLVVQNNEVVIGKAKHHGRFWSWIILSDLELKCLRCLAVFLFVCESPALLFTCLQ